MILVLVGRHDQPRLAQVQTGPSVVNANIARLGRALALGTKEQASFKLRPAAPHSRSRLVYLRLVADLSDKVKREMGMEGQMRMETERTQCSLTKLGVNGLGGRCMRERLGHGARGDAAYVSYGRTDEDCTFSIRPW
jgi:hypothetical protein